MGCKEKIKKETIGWQFEILAPANLQVKYIPVIRRDKNLQILKFCELWTNQTI